MSTQAVTPKASSAIPEAELEKARQYFRKEETKANKKDFSINTTQVQGGIDSNTKGISLNSLDYVGDLRGENQTGFEQLRNGVAKNLVKTGLRVGEGLISVPIILAGILKSGANKLVGAEDSWGLSEAINNPISKGMDDAITGLDKMLPNFKTQEQQDSFWENVKSTNFWADSALDGVSYALSAYYTGKIATKGIGAVVKQVSKKALLSSAESLLGNEATGLLDASGKGASFGQKVLNNAQSIASSAIAAVSESGAEARQTYEAVRKAKEEQILAKKRAVGDYSDLDETELSEAKEQAVWAGNANFGINLLMTGGANYAQMGKLFNSRYKNDALNLDRIVGKAGEAKVSELGKIGRYFNKLVTGADGTESKTLLGLKKASDKVKPFYDDIFTEVAQEGGQTFTDKFLTDYFTEDDTSNARTANAFNTAMHDTFQTKEGWESMFLGGLIGGGSMALKHFSGNGNDYQKDEQRLADATKLLNEAGVALNPTVKKLYNSFAKSTDINQSKNAAIQDNDKFSYKTLDKAELFNIVDAHLETGRIDDLTDQIKGIKNMTDDEFKTAYEITADGISKDKFADELLSKVTAIKNTAENLKINYNHLLDPDQIKKLSLIASMKEDFSAREASILTELKDTFGFDYNENIVKKKINGKDLEDQNGIITKEQNKANSLMLKIKQEKGLLAAITDEDAKTVQQEKITALNTELNGYKNNVQAISALMGDAITDKDYLKSLDKLTAGIKGEFETDNIREVQQGIEDPTKRQEFDNLLADLKKIQTHKNYVIGAYNNMVNPKTYAEEFARIEKSLRASKENRTIKEAFTVFSGEKEVVVDAVTGKKTNTGKAKPIVLEKGLYTGVITKESYEQWKQSSTNKAGKTTPAYQFGKGTMAVDTPNNLIEIRDRRINEQGKGEVLVSFNGEEAQWKNANSLRFKELKSVKGEAVTEEEAFYFKYGNRLITMSVEQGYTFEEARAIQAQNQAANKADPKKGFKFTDTAYGAQVKVVEHKGYLGMNKKGEITFRVMGADGNFTELQEYYLTKPVITKVGDTGSKLTQTIFPYQFKVNQSFKLLGNGIHQIHSQVKEIASEEDSNKDLFALSSVRQIAKLEEKIGRVANVDGENGKIQATIAEELAEWKTMGAEVRAINVAIKKQIALFANEPNNEDVKATLDLLYYRQEGLVAARKRVNESIAFNQVLLEKAKTQLGYIEKQLADGVSFAELNRLSEELTTELQTITEPILEDYKLRLAQQEATFLSSQAVIAGLDAQKEVIDTIMYNDLFGAMGVKMEDVQKIMQEVGYDAMSSEQEIKDFLFQNLDIVLDKLGVTINTDEYFDKLNEIQASLKQEEDKVYKGYKDLLEAQTATIKLAYQKLAKDSPLNADGIPEKIDTLKMLNDTLAEYKTIREYAMRDMRRSVTIDQMKNNGKFNQPYNFKDDTEIEDGTQEGNTPGMAQPSVFHNGEFDSQSPPQQLIRPFLKTTGLLRDFYNLFTGKEGNTPEQKKLKGEYIYNNLVTTLNENDILLEYVTDLPSDYEANSVPSIHTIITDLQGNRLYFNINGEQVKEGTENSYLAISTLTAPTAKYAGGADRFYDLDKIDAALYQQSLDAYTAYVESIKEKLKTTKKHFVRPSGKSFGIRNTDDEKKPLDQITKLSLAQVGQERTNKDSKIIVATSNRTTIGTTIYDTVAGHSYYVDGNSGKVIPLDTRNLEELEVNSIINGIIYYHNQEDVSASRQIKQKDLLNDTLGKLLLWGKEKTGQRQRSYQIYFKPGTNDTTIVYGEVKDGVFAPVEITLNSLVAGEDTAFRAFLASRKLQVSKNSLDFTGENTEEKKNQFLAKNAAKDIEGLTPSQIAILRNTNNYYVTYYPTPDGYKLEKFDTYEHYLARGNRSVKSVVRSNMVRGNSNTATSVVIPQWSNTYFRINPEEYIPQVKKADTALAAPIALSQAFGGGQAVNMAGTTPVVAVTPVVAGTVINPITGRPALGNNVPMGGVVTVPSAVLGGRTPLTNNVPLTQNTSANPFGNNPVPSGFSTPVTTPASAPGTVASNAFAGFGAPAVTASPFANPAMVAPSNVASSLNAQSNPVPAQAPPYSAQNTTGGLGGAMFTPPGSSPLVFTEDGNREPKYDSAGLAGAVKRLQDRYPELEISKVVGLIDSKYFGLFTEVGKVFLSDLAPLGTDFHEEFHIIEQLYLGKNELAELYRQYREGKPGQTLSDNQVSELLAEEFRYYALNQNAKATNNWLQNFFAGLYKFIQGVLRLQQNENINQLFASIYSGNFANQQALSTKEQITTGELNQINNHLSFAVPFLINTIITLPLYYGSPDQRRGVDITIDNYFTQNGYAEYYPEAKSSLEKLAFIAIQNLYQADNQIPPRLKLKIGQNFRAIIDAFKAEDEKRNSIFDDLDMAEEVEKESKSLNVDASHLHNSNEKDYAGKPIEVFRQMLNGISNGTVSSLGFSEGVDSDKYVKKLMFDMQEVESMEEVYSILEKGDVVYRSLFDMFKKANGHLPNLSYIDRVGYVNTRNKFLKQVAMNHLEYTTHILDYNYVNEFTSKFTFKSIVENKAANDRGAKALFESAMNLHLTPIRKNIASGIVTNPYYSINTAGLLVLNGALVKKAFNLTGKNNTLLPIEEMFNQLSFLGIDFVYAGLTKNENNLYTEGNVLAVLQDNNVDVTNLKEQITKFVSYYADLNTGEFNTRNLNPFNKEVFNKLSPSVTIITDLQRIFSGNNLNFSLLSAKNKQLYAFQKQSTLSKKIKRMSLNGLKINAKLCVINGLKKSNTIKDNTTYEDGQTTNSLTASEMFLTFFNSIMGGQKGKATTVPYIFPGSKRMTYGIQGFNNLLFNASPVKVITSLLKEELESIMTVKEEKASSNFVITNRHVRGTKGNLKPGEGESLTTMKDIFKNKDLLVLFDKIVAGDIPIEKLDELAKDSKGLLATSINAYMEQQKAVYIKFLEKEGILLDSNGIITINGIDTSILNTTKELNSYGLDTRNVKNKATEESISLLLNDFILTTMENLSEQLKYLTGEANYYKDPLKRFTGAMGTKSNIHIGDEFINDFNEHLKNRNSTWNHAQYPMGKTARVLVINDRIIPDAGKAEYIKAEFEAKGKNPNNAVEAYYQNNIADGQGYESLEFFRFREIAEGIWGEGAKETIYNKLMANEAVTKEELDVLLNLGAYLNTSKTQAFTEFSKFGINHPMFIKTSVFIPSLVKGTALAELGDFMDKNGLSMVFYESAVKVGRVVNKDTNSGLDAFDDNGLFNEEAMDGFENYVQNIDLAYYGTQVDTNPKPKEKTTVGSQERKMIMSNIFRVLTDKVIGTKEYQEAKNWVTTTVDKINALEIFKAKNALVELKERLGLIQDVNGNYAFGDKKELILALTEEARLRDLPKSFSNDINYILNNDYSLDMVARKPKLESVLMALVSKGVIKTKVKGDSKAQVSSSGFTSFSREDIKEDFKDIYKLGFYPTDVKNNKDFVMEVYLPSYLKGKVNIGRTISFNYEAKGEERLDPLLQVLGFRIPTQGLNSIESIRVKGFLPESMGNTIVVPYQITAKSGSDFDIDKLNLYFPSYYTNKNDENVYIRPFDEEDFTLSGYNTYLDNAKNPNLSLTEFQKMEIDNAILETHLDIFQRPENRLEILTPNTEYDVKGVAKGQNNAEYPYAESVRGLRGLAIEDSKSNLLDILFLIKKKISFEVGKGVLGQFALHSTHHVLSQMAGLKVNTKAFVAPYFASYRGSGRNGELNSIEDVRGNLISKNIEQPGNAAVDVEKDDYLLDINITEDTVSIYCYLLRLGIPLQEASYFLSQPAITEYLEQYYKLLASNVETVSKSKAEERALAMITNKYAGTDETMPPFTIDSLKEGIRQGANNKVPNAKQKAFQTNVLSEFFRQKKIADTLNNFMGISNQDTGAVSTSMAGNDLLAIREKLFAEGRDRGGNLMDITEGTTVTTINILENTDNFFNKDGKQTYLGYFRDVVREANKMFTPLFLIKQWSDRLKGASDIMQGVSESYSSTDDKIGTINIIKNELLAYIVLNLNQVTIQSRAEALLKGNNSVAMRLLKYQKAGINNYLIDELRPIIPLESDTTIHDIYLYDAANTSPERNDKLVDGFQEMYDLDPLFTLDLINQSILQSGFNNSPTTIHNIIPAELLLKVVDTFYLDHNTQLGTFEKQLVANNSNRPMLFGTVRYSPGGYITSNNNFRYYKGRVKNMDGTSRTAVFEKTVNNGVDDFNEVTDLKGFAKFSSMRSYKIEATTTDTKPDKEFDSLEDRVKQCIY